MRTKVLWVFMIWAGASAQAQDSLQTARILNQTAALLAGYMPPDSTSRLAKSAVVYSHYTKFESSWQSLHAKRLSKQRVWRDQALASLQDSAKTLFYPFSGPDFLNAYELFPECEQYLLFGLERAGELPAWNTLESNAAYLESYLGQLRQSLSEIFQRNYFITARMSGALNTATVRGVLPLISVFLARTNNEILKIERIWLEKNGKQTYTSLGFQSKYALLSGICIHFKNRQKDKIQKVYYFGTDLADAALMNKKELVEFIKTFPQKVTLVKSASYLLHTTSFTLMRRLIVEQSRAIVEDDTGVPYKYLPSTEWEIDLYGKYARPIRDFNYGYQPDLQAEFTKRGAAVPALDFTFGYHWWTDKTSLIVARKRTP